jgi:hypothetical protein
MGRGYVHESIGLGRTGPSSSVGIVVPSTSFARSGHKPLAGPKFPRGLPLAPQVYPAERQLLGPQATVARQAVVFPWAVRPVRFFSRGA